MGWRSTQRSLARKAAESGGTSNTSAPTSSYKTQEGETVYVYSTPTGTVSGTAQEIAAQGTVSHTALTQVQQPSIPTSPTGQQQITVDKSKSFAEQVSEYQAKKLGTYGKLNVPSSITVQILNKAESARRDAESAKERGVYEYIASGKGTYGASAAEGAKSFFREKGYSEEVGMEALGKNWDIMAQATGLKDAKIVEGSFEKYGLVQPSSFSEKNLYYGNYSGKGDLMAQATTKNYGMMPSAYAEGDLMAQATGVSRKAGIEKFRITGMEGTYTEEQLKKAQLVSTDESGTQQWIIPTEQELFSQKTEEGFEKFNIFKPLTWIGKQVSGGGDIAYEKLNAANPDEGTFAPIVRSVFKAVGGLWQMPESMEKFAYKTVKGVELGGAKGGWEATGELTYNPLKWGEKAEFALNVATLVYPSAKETGLAVRELVATKIIGKVAPKLLDNKLIAKLMGTEEVVYAGEKVAGTAAKQTLKTTAKKILTYPLKHPIITGFTGLAVYDVAATEDKGKAFESVMTDLTRYYLQARLGGAAGKSIANLGELKFVSSKTTPIKDLGKGVEQTLYKRTKLESGKEFYYESGKIQHQIKNVYKNIYGKIRTEIITAETPQGGWEANLEKGKAEFSLRKENYEQMGKKATPKLKEMKIGRATQVFDLRAKETKFPDVFEIYSKGKVGIKEPYANIENIEYYDVFGRWKIKGKVIAERVEQGLVQTKGANGEIIIETKPVKLVQLQKFVGVRDIKMLKALEKGELKDYNVPKKVYIPKGTKVETLKTAFGGKSVIIENIPKGIGMRKTAYIDLPYETGMAKAKRLPIREAIKKLTKLPPMGKKGQLLITLEKPRLEKPEVKVMTMANLERKFMVKEPKLETQYQKSADITARQSTKDMLKLLGKFERPKLEYKPPRTIPMVNLRQIEKQLLQPKQVQQPKQVTSPLTRQIEKQLQIPRQTTTQITKQITKVPTIPIPRTPYIPRTSYIPKIPIPILPIDFGYGRYGGRRKGRAGRGQPSPTYIQDFTSRAVGMKSIKMTKKQVRELLLGTTFTGMELRRAIQIR